MVFDLTDTQRAGCLRGSAVIGRQRLLQSDPVRGNARHAVLGTKGQKRRAVMRIRARVHLAVGAQPFHLAQAVQRLALCVPARRVGPAEPGKQRRRRDKRLIVGMPLP